MFEGKIHIINLFFMKNKRLIAMVGRPQSFVEKYLPTSEKINLRIVIDIHIIERFTKIGKCSS